jgi:hypothetical protein
MAHENLAIYGTMSQTRGFSPGGWIAKRPDMGIGDAIGLDRRRERLSRKSIALRVGRIADVDQARRAGRTQRGDQLLDGGAFIADREELVRRHGRLPRLPAKAKA